MNDTLTQNTAASFAQNWTETNLPFSNSNLSEAKLILENTPFPTTRVEAWKYTRVTKISKQNFSSAIGKVTDLSKFTILNSAPTLVFINGMYSTELSTISPMDGVEISPISQAENVENLGENVVLENEVFNALNTLYAMDGAYIRFRAGKQIDQTIQVLFIQSGEQAHSQIRNKIVAEKGANGKVLMAFFSDNAEGCFSNVVTELEVGENAHLDIDKLQLENESSFQISSEYVAQGRDSHFDINTITLDGLLVRNNLNIAVNGQNCNTHLNGMYLTKGRQHVDNHTIVDHCVPNCESFELYKGVMDEHSTAVFNGKVFVRQDAQKINAFQSNGNVLLGENATINSKPELEIYADDVKCSHGSTTGQLDEEAVFYLRARGISEKAARHMMISAFVGDVLEKIKNEEVLSFVEGILQRKFGFATMN
jgi:Fe-S cluster assembly protein SufD